MLRPMLAALTVILVVPAAAYAQTALSETDQQRVVCAPKRDQAGNKIAGQICMSGREWQKALAKVRMPGKYRYASARSSRSSGAGHLAYPNYFRTSAW